MKRELLFDIFPIDLISQKDFIKIVAKWCGQKNKKMIFYSNVHTIVTASQNNEFLKTLEKANIIYADGWGPIIAHGSSFKRVNAADFTPQLFTKLNKGKPKIYLIGESVDLVRKTAGVLESKYNQIKVVGYHEGFFGSKKSASIIQDIKKRKPNLVLVGMGTPKQEFWITNNWDNLPNSVYWGVGGLFGYMVGSKKRAPLWMRSYSLEWLYRLFQEPKRLWYRYTVENIKFFCYLVIYLFKKAFISFF